MKNQPGLIRGRGHRKTLMARLLPAVKLALCRESFVTYELNVAFRYQDVEKDVIITGKTSSFIPQS